MRFLPLWAGAFLTSCHGNYGIGQLGPVSGLEERPARGQKLTGLLLPCNHHHGPSAAAAAAATTRTFLFVCTSFAMARQPGACIRLLCCDLQPHTRRSISYEREREIRGRQTLYTLASIQGASTMVWLGSPHNRHTIACIIRVGTIPPTPAAFYPPPARAAQTAATWPVEG